MKENEEIKQKKIICELQHKYDKKKHKMKMEELAFMRESDRLHHEREKERQRIKSAEIRRMQERKDFFIRTGKNK